MFKTSIVLFLASASLRLAALTYLKQQDALLNRSDRSIAIVGDQFILDGKPLQIVSGSVHYFQVPSEYWRDRLLKLKAAGLNSVSTYVEWRYHEPEERQYQFGGDRDVVKFIRIADELGLHVLLRPGPYIDAERDLGGFPYWVLSKYPKIKLRSTDKDYMVETETWLAKLFEKIRPLLYGNGGPIILVQVENEYGAVGNDMKYKKQMRDILKKYVCSNALLYTTDQRSEWYFKRGYIPEVLTTIDFGVASEHDIKEYFDGLRKFMPSGPLMDSEFYAGWITHWGDQYVQTSKERVVRSLRYMLTHNMNVNIYMFAGGTNFEYDAGAYVDSSIYRAIQTSYDFDAPLSESGDMTPKYQAIRELMEQFYPDVKNNTPPEPSRKGAYGKVTVGAAVELLSTEGRSKFGKKYDDVTSATLPTFESLRQRAGLLLYETALDKADGMGTLQILKPRDRIYVYVDGRYQGLIDREKHHFNLTIESKKGSTLSLLVENQGRVCKDLKDFKGILSNVMYNKEALDGKWTITGYPLEHVHTDAQSLHQSSAHHGPVLYEGTLSLPLREAPMDTFLDTTGWQKGYVWVNGRGLGRYWSRGPQVTLYVPGVWLRPGNNFLHVLELERASTTLAMTSIDYPILNRTTTAPQLEVQYLNDIRQHVIHNEIINYDNYYFYFYHERGGVGREGRRGEERRGEERRGEERRGEK